MCLCLVFSTILSESNAQIPSPILPRSSFALRSPLPRSRTRSSSIGSSTTSLTERHQHEPIASTSKKNRDSSKLTRVELNLEENHRLATDLNDAAHGTHAERLNPSRDGYYTRLNGVLLRYGASVGLGTALGAGIVDINNRIHAKKTATTTTTETSADNIDSEVNNF